MNRTLLCLTAALLSTGCLTGRVRSEASFTLRCPELQISLTERQTHQWEADGCGQIAVCSIGEGDRAEVMCVNGGPIPKVPPPGTVGGP